MIEGDLDRLSIVSRESDTGGVWQPSPISTDDDSRRNGALNFRFQVFKELIHVLRSSTEFRLSKRDRFGEA